MIPKPLSRERALPRSARRPSGGVVELRRHTRAPIPNRPEGGPTNILTTQYIEEAEEMADRVGVISKGELIAVDEKQDLIAKMGRKTLDIVLADPLAAVPGALSDWKLELADDGRLLRYQFD